MAEFTLKVPQGKIDQIMREALKRCLADLAVEDPEAGLFARVVELELQRQDVLDYVTQIECGNCDHVHNDGRCAVVREFTGPCRCDWGPNPIVADIRNLLSGAGT